MARVYKIGTRKSPLALKQVEEVSDALKQFYPAINTEVIRIDTYGDQDKNTPISDVEGSDFFTKEIDEALLKRKIDFAVHSAKDLPEKVKKGLITAAITKGLDPHDVLVSKKGFRLDELRRGARIGTSSRRRKDGLKKHRPDLRVEDIRGNIGERLAKLDNSGLDGIVTAGCALFRLGLESRIAHIIPFEIIEPHPLQGTLALVARKDDRHIIELLSGLDSKNEI